jgi:hypothetical protein
VEVYNEFLLHLTNADEKVLHSRLKVKKKMISFDRSQFLEMRRLTDGLLTNFFLFKEYFCWPFRDLLENSSSESSSPG